MIRELLAKRTIVNSSLSYPYRDAEGSRWRLRSASLIPAVTAFNAAHRAIRDLPKGSCEEVYKWTERRQVFRFRGSGTGREFLVAKGFLLKNARQRIKSYRYGLDETANLLMAAQRGISVPAIYGFGVQYGKSGLPRGNFLLLECLSDYGLVGDLLEKAKDNPIERRAVLMRTIPVFVSLYHAGCNHVDIHKKTIMMHNDVEKPPKILDFHYARFCDRPNIEVLAFEAGFFVGACSDTLDQGAIEEWLSSLAHEVGLGDESERRAFVERVSFYRREDLSRKQKINVGRRP